MRMTHEPVRVTGGVDTHMDVHVAVAVCSRSQRLLGCEEFDSTPAGYVKLLAWLLSFGPIDAVGVEGTGSYGAGLARFLTAERIAVIEVDRSDRKARRDQGKSDPVDAEAAARAVLSGRATGTPKTRDGVVETIRVLQVVYRSAISARTATINQFHAMVTAAPAELREQLRDLRRDDQLARARGFRNREHDDQVATTTRQALKALAKRVAFLTKQAEQVEAQLDVLTEQAAPALRDVHGVGTHTAAALLVTVGDNPQRIRSEAALARICGVSPIPASSGKTRRHRLNRGGNRAANHALWRIALVRRTSHPPTKAYHARRTAEGLSDREIMRCLKRYIVREIYRALTATSTLAPRGSELRQRRHDLELPLRIVAEATGTHISTLSRLERGLLHDPQLATRVHAWLHQPQEPELAA